MADIATVFSWPPNVMDEMPIAELMHWHRLAVDRFKAIQGK